MMNSYFFPEAKRHKIGKILLPNFPSAQMYHAEFLLFFLISIIIKELGLLSTIQSMASLLLKFSIIIEQTC